MLCDERLDVSSSSSNIYSYLNTKYIGHAFSDHESNSMQEEMLSKRVLYFVDDKVFFHCPYKTVMEGCSEFLWKPEGSLLRMKEPFRDYKDLIEAYSKRVLSRDEDAFRAISGILGRISHKQRWQIIAGMPAIALERMMLFQRRHHVLCRRRAFASYSWLGWKGALEFMRGVDVRGDWIVWYVWNAGTVERLGTNRAISHFKPDLGLLPDMDFGHQVPSIGHREPSPRSFTLLCFWTLAVFFDLKAVDYVKGTAEIHQRVGPKVCSRYAGYITLDGLDDYPLSDVGEFILLSKVSLQSGEYKKYRYTVMLIDWVDGVAERRGIGYISPSEIQNSLAPGPIWKEIVLG